MYSYTIILYRTYRKQIINVGTGGLLYISHIFSVKWSFGMSDKSSDIQSYLICFGSNDISHISLLQGHRLSHSPEDGIIFTNFSLVLQRINQSQAGKYMCESSNRVGKGRSENIFLDVKCKIISSLFYPSGAFINNITTVFLYL